MLSPGESVCYKIMKLSVTRLGDFSKFLATNFLTKVAQTIIDIWDNFEKNHNFLSQPVVATFWATFSDFWATFYSNTWSQRCPI